MLLNHSLHAWLPESPPPRCGAVGATCRSPFTTGAVILMIRCGAMTTATRFQHQCHTTVEELRVRRQPFKHDTARAFGRRST